MTHFVIRRDSTDGAAWTRLCVTSLMARKVAMAKKA
jgi:hypothetical protein